MKFNVLILVTLYNKYLLCNHTLKGRIKEGRCYITTIRSTEGLTNKDCPVKKPMNCSPRKTF